MVKVSKIGVWKVEGQYHESADSATKAVRRQIIQELITAETPSEEEMADWMADSWDIIESRVKAAMTGC